LIAFEKLDGLRDDVAFRPWLAQVAVSQVRRRFRRRKLLRLFGLVDDEAGLSELASPGASAEVLSDLALLDAALRRLPDEQRIAWVLRHVEGLALDEVARAVECSLATAKRRIAAADERVRAHVENLP
jgi:RNA polymerase sigma-70 factor (ECF subfamily)